MKVQDAINTAIPALKTTDTVEDALGLLMEHHIRHLPVVNEDDQLVGIISEEQMMSADGPDEMIGDLLSVHPVSVRPQEHIFDAARTMVEHGLSTVPVTPADGARYLGLLRRHDIFDEFAKLMATQRSGAIIALEVDQRDYALAKLVHLIEQNDAKVLAVASEEPDSSTEKIRVTLKLNVTDTTRIRHVLEHNDYHVVASFGEDDTEMKNRVDEFMRYLEV
ncbi:acetoin utilization protein [Longibacter salinarum]|uniref:Acetoin utilization protein n=1 Tax=Longibacter salinarum TaxID=1850348 RepID=A0A2A8CZR7_9BACT|nr:CBS domain-containing protein [Longibacter salinarum]PEN14175.1 acetoin utilization protein [Longibacter salinarum]